MTPTQKAIRFSLAITTQLDSSYDIAAAKAQAELARAGGAVETTISPILPSGLTRRELNDIVAEIGIEYFRPAAERLIQSLNAVKGDEQGEYAFERFNVIGGEKVYVVDGDEYTDPDEALKAYVRSAEDDGEPVTEGYASVEDALESLAEDGDIEITFSNEELFPPMWNTLWKTDWLPGGWERSYADRAQEIAEFCGVTIYEDTEGDEEFLLGVNGAGYDFYEAHWIPLAYLWGRYSN